MNPASQVPDISLSFPIISMYILTVFSMEGIKKASNHVTIVTPRGNKERTVTATIGNRPYVLLNPEHEVTYQATFDDGQTTWKHFFHFSEGFDRSKVAVLRWNLSGGKGRKEIVMKVSTSTRITVEVHGRGQVTWDAPVELGEYLTLGFMAAVEGRYVIRIRSNGIVIFETKFMIQGRGMTRALKENTKMIITSHGDSGILHAYDTHGDGIDLMSVPCPLPSHQEHQGEVSKGLSRIVFLDNHKCLRDGKQYQFDGFSKIDIWKKAPLPPPITNTFYVLNAKLLAGVRGSERDEYVSDLLVRFGLPRNCHEVCYYNSALDPLLPKIKVILKTEFVNGINAMLQDEQTMWTIMNIKTGAYGPDRHKWTMFTSAKTLQMTVLMHTLIRRTPSLAEKMYVFNGRVVDYEDRVLKLEDLFGTHPDVDHHYVLYFVWERYL